MKMLCRGALKMLWWGVGEEWKVMWKFYWRGGLVFQLEDRFPRVARRGSNVCL
ncbi:hypothetical protein HMPREF0297_1045 [Corynebacterium jeikeium ATCC 43734]|nr:hypothetical protein HMPREF0297_1045 [Corynebacterium jeikeium ATCC 43734]